MASISEQHAGNLLTHRVTLTLWILLLSVVSLLISGYRDVYGANHGFQLLLVQKINNPTLYPGDPVAGSIFSYASLFWYGVAWLVRLFDLSAVLLVLFWLKNLLFLFAGYRWARLLFPHSWGAWYAGTLFLATSPSPLIGNGQPSNGLEQTSFSIVFVLLALESLVRRQGVGYMLWMGLVPYFNQMYAIFGYSYVLTSVLADSTLRRRWLLWASATAGSIVIGLPGWLLLLQAARKPVADPLAVWQTAELSYPYHFFPETWSLVPQLILLGYVVVLFVLCRFWDRIDSRLRLHLMLWTGLAFGYYFLAWLAPHWLRSLTLLHLHPIRATELWFLLTGIFLAGVAVAWGESLPVDARTRWFTPLTLLVCLGILWRFGYGAGFGVRGLLLLMVGAELYRQIARRTAFPTSVGAMLALCLMFTLANAVRIHTIRVSKYGNWWGIPSAPAYEIARWARVHTPPDAVFLIPFYSDAAGWHQFRHLSQRSVFATRKDGMAWTFAPAYAREWIARMRAAGLFEAAGLNEATYRIGAWVKFGDVRPDADIFRQASNRLDDARVQQIAQRYRIDYWIVPLDKPTRFPTVHTHKGWKVVRVLP
jgi:hypothetical protein